MVAFFCSMYYIFMIILFILFINSNYLLKLQRLLHDRIDPTVEKLRKKPRILKIKRVQRCKTTTSMPPVDTPNWCLTDEALKRFNPYEKKSSNFCTIFVQVRVEIVQLLQIFG